MSIKIGSSAKDVIDVVFGTSSSTKKNVDVVKDWNGKIIWQRNKTKQLTSSNTRIVLEGNTTSFSGWGYSRNYSFKPGVVHVYYTEDGVERELTRNTEWKVKGYTNDPGTISRTSYGSETINASVTIEGVASGGYSGEVSKAYTGTWEYRKQTLYYYVRFNKDSSSASGSMGDQQIERDKSTNLTKKNAFSNGWNVFGGWATQSGGSKEYSDQESVLNIASAGSTIDLYAIWNSGNWTITSVVSNMSSSYTVTSNSYYMPPRGGSRSPAFTSQVDSVTVTFTGTGGITKTANFTTSSSDLNFTTTTTAFVEGGQGRSPYKINSMSVGTKTYVSVYYKHLTVNAIPYVSSFSGSADTYYYLLSTDTGE